VILYRKKPGERATNLPAIDGPRVYRTRDEDNEIILYLTCMTADRAVTQVHMAVREARQIRDRLDELLSIIPE
jgi:hypothetical protein